MYWFGQVPGISTSLNSRSTGWLQLSVAVTPATAGTCSAQDTLTEAAGRFARTGAVTSLIVITCTKEAILPQSSSADQVRVMLYWFGQVPGISTSLNSRSTGAPQLSVAVTLGTCGTCSEQDTLTNAAVGRPASTGATISEILIVCTKEAMLPQSSSAVHVRVMLYWFGQVPGTSTSLNSTSTGAPQLSEAVTVGTAGTCSEQDTFTEAEAGRPARTGAWVSLIVIVCTKEVALPAKSTAVQVRVMLYWFGQVPGTSTSVKSKSTVPWQLSDTVTFATAGTCSEQETFTNA